MIARNRAASKAGSALQASLAGITSPRIESGRGMRRSDRRPAGRAQPVAAGQEVSAGPVATPALARRRERRPFTPGAKLTLRRDRRACHLSAAPTPSFNRTASRASNARASAPVLRVFPPHLDHS